MSKSPEENWAWIGIFKPAEPQSPCLFLFIFTPPW